MSKVKPILYMLGKGGALVFYKQLYLTKYEAVQPTVISEMIPHQGC